MFLTIYGAGIPAIGSLVPIMPKSSALIQGFTSLVRVELTHFLRIGLVIITGCAPPVYLMCKVIKHMEICSAQGILIVPLWKSAHFWPILCSDGFHWSLSMTRLSCLVCLVYLLEEKLRTQFLVASH